MNEAIIRPYQTKDRAAVKILAWDTALVGRSAEIFFDGKDIFGEFLVSYFTDYEPESCFVAEYNNEIIGYLVGGKDAHHISKVFSTKILPVLLLKALGSGVFLKKKNLIFFFHFFKDFLKGELRNPDFSVEYPATFHINLKKGYRSLHIGTRMVTMYLDYLEKENVKGVYLATMSEGALGFFERLGFQKLFTGNRSYFEYFLLKKVPLFMYGKKLQNFKNPD